MLTKAQVTLHVTKDKTAKLVDSLKEEKRLRSVLGRFLDKYAENPELMEVWLESNEVMEVQGYSDDTEKIVKLKQNLTLFTSFLEVAKTQNDYNVDSFTDSLTSEEFIQFKTNFKKAESLIENTNDSDEDLTIVSNVENESLKEEVLSLKEQMNQLQITLFQYMNESKEALNNTKILPTNNSIEQVQVIDKTEEKLPVLERDDDKVEVLPIELEEKSNPFIEEEVLPLTKQDSEDIPEESVDEALDILNALQGM